MEKAVVNENICRGCFICVRSCPVKGIRVYDRHAHVDITRCVGCGSCVKACPFGALSCQQNTV